MKHALISIKPQYVEKILKGEKKIELRTRSLKMPNNSFLWIYSTLPAATISALVKIKTVEVQSPAITWEKYYEVIGISYKQFLDYIGDSNNISSIIFESIYRLNGPTLNNIREKFNNFNPPQFFKYIRYNDPLFKYFIERNPHVADFVFKLW